LSQHIGKYELLDRIAEGGFGVVFKARDPFIKRLVAIKTCALDHEDLRQRFFREAQIAGAFDHPNVTIVHDFGVEEGTAYLVQEYLSGEDLSAKIRRRDPLPVGVKIDYLLQIARGLAYAHDKGVIHRDIKPPNVRVLESGQVKIMDFGIAKLATSSTRLTRQGMAVGTVGYLAPEQLADEPLDHRTDIFAFGVVAYELFSFQRPFEGRDLTTVMRGILEGEPKPLSEVVEGLPPDLVTLIHRCLAKNREDRPASFQVVIAELEALQHREGPAVAVAGEGRTVILAPSAAPRPAPSPAAAPAKPPRGRTPSGPANGPTPELASGRDTGRETREVEVASQAVSTASAPGAAGTEEVLPRLDAVLQPEETAGPRRKMAGTAPATDDRAPRPITRQGSAALPAPAPLSATPAPPAGGAATPASPAAKAAPGPPAPEGKEPAATSGAAAPVAADQGLGVKPLWILAAIVGFAVFLGVASVGGWWLYRSLTAEAAAAPEAPVARPPVAPPAPAVEPGRSLLTVVATPWGEILSIVDQEGQEVPWTGDRFTPSVLRLSPGVYRVTVASPASEEPQECVVELAADEAATCRVELSFIEPFEYFRETGWWQ
jgi:eukaryotic-like serine/threonine-protein kinase